MAKFFIDRPIFAWVIALFVIVLGAVSITKLPIAQYPPVAPPAIVLTATYPGASASTLEESVITVIEQEMNGSPGMIYMESVTQANGVGQITISFEPGTNPDLAQVDVQNRLARATPRLPRRSRSRACASTSRAPTSCCSRSCPPTTPTTRRWTWATTPRARAARDPAPARRRPGAAVRHRSGDAHLDRPGEAGRLQPVAGRRQRRHPRAERAGVGRQHRRPAEHPGQGISATVVVPGQLSTPEQFGNIVLRANTDGSTVRLKDVARVELNAQTFATSARLNGKPSTGIGVQLSPSGNALATADAVRKRMGELAPYFPRGMKWDIPYDSSRFVRISISQVVETLLEAVALVFLVMFLFLQNWRYTIIPTLVVPVALLGTFGALLALGFSINVLTMFGMVLVIGIVVDDAIVVVENVERIMSEEGLPPREATRKAMGQISGRHHRRDGGADLGVRAAGLLRRLHRQHLPPVLGGDGGVDRLLGLHGAVAHAGAVRHAAQAGGSRPPRGEARLLRRFNRGFSRTAHGYEGVVARMLRRAPWYLILYAAIAGVAALFYTAPAHLVPAAGRPGQHDGERAAAAGRDAGAHARA
jgi:multidrug efflux pump